MPPARAISPSPLTPSIPYPTPMPTDRTRPTTIVVPAEAGTSTLSASNCRRRPSAVGLRGWPPVPGVRFARPSATPNTYLRRAPDSFRGWLARPLSPICDRRLKSATAKRPPSWTLSPRVTQSMQFQAAPISPRIDSRTCTALPQAREGRKKRANSIQFNSNRPVRVSSPLWVQGLPCPPAGFELPATGPYTPSPCTGGVKSPCE